MDKNAPIRGICFDLWNTLAFTDSTSSPVFALASAFGLVTGHNWRREIENAIMTRPLAGISDAIDAIASSTGRELAEPWTRRNLILSWGAACNQNRLYPDSLPTLRALRTGRTRYRLGIISNTQSFDLELLRRDLEPLVDAVCLSCHEGILKPDPEIFHRAAAMLNMPESEVLMVGDRVVDDMEGGASAGLRGVLLDRTGRSVWEGPSITTLSDLTRIITP